MPAQPDLPPLNPDGLVFETGLTMESVAINRGDTLSDLLTNAGVDQSTQVQMIAAIAETFDVRKFRHGTQLTLIRETSGTPASLEYVIDPDHKLELMQSDGAYRSEVVDIPGVMREVPICATLEGSLFESIERVGENPELAVRLAEVFAYDIDFFRDPRAGDKFCLLVEKKEYANGQAPTYQRILAAKYINAGKAFDAFLFSTPDDNGKPAYYASDGRSLQSAFLRSPLKFDARVSSHFSAHRLHPVTGVVRAHYGTDYAAPTGTPVYAVAAGKVVFSALSGGSGNLIRIRHANGYESLYLHLSRRLVGVGQTIQQGERIGLVGSTGLATGPHLDFRLRRNGSYINWERLKLPPTTQITAENKGQFNVVRDRALHAMNVSTSTEVVASNAKPVAAPAP